MEVRDGFVDSIFNYCDRWCERCAFTSWCRLFAEKAEAEAEGDPTLKPVLEAPLLPQDVPPDPPREVQELIEELNQVAADISNRHLPPARSTLDSDDYPVLQRARSYFSSVHRWVDEHHIALDDPGS